MRGIESFKLWVLTRKQIGDWHFNIYIGGKHGLRYIGTCYFSAYWSVNMIFGAFIVCIPFAVKYLLEVTFSRNKQYITVLYSLFITLNKYEIPKETKMLLLLILKKIIPVSTSHRKFACKNNNFNISLSKGYTFSLQNLTESCAVV